MYRNARQDQHDDGEQEAQDRVRLSILHMRFEDQGKTWPEANRLARAALKEEQDGRAYRAAHQAAQRRTRHAH